MKEIFISFISFLLLIGCKQDENKNVESSDEKIIENKFVQKLGNPYFKFDEVEYYHTEIEEEKIMDLYDEHNNSKLDKLRFEIIIGEKPENLANLDFINSLTKIGFTKSQISKSKLKDINLIFTEKTVSENYAAACIAVYRDVLIFKKNKKIIGSAKICFGCRQFRIKGTKANTENFGQDGDFEKLEYILKNNQ